MVLIEVEAQKGKLKSDDDYINCYYFFKYTSIGNNLFKKITSNKVFGICWLI